MRFFHRVKKLYGWFSRMEERFCRVEERIARIENQAAEIGNHVSTLISAQEAQAHVQTALLETMQHLSDVQELLIPSVVEGSGEGVPGELSGGEGMAPQAGADLDLSNITLSFEVRLAQAILPFLSSTEVVDVGAYQGDFSLPLLRKGYKVTAIEPNGQQVDYWEGLTSNYPNLEFLRAAISSECGEVDFHPVEFSEEGNAFVETPGAFSTISPHPLPEGLVYGDRQTVPMETLASLAEQGKIPAKPGLVKIDAEGQDGVVIESMEDVVRPEVIFAEFWSEDLPLWGKECRNGLDDLTTMAHERGCFWGLTLCSQWGSDAVSVGVSVDQLPEQSWGSVVFFRDFDVYRKSYRAAKRILPGG